MTVAAERTSNLLPRFQEFYSELLRLQEQIGAAPELPPEAVSQPLGELLERQAEEARASIDPLEFEVYREAQYVMAALADEIFAHLGWNGRQNWESLELRLFRASAAGELFFRKLDWLLQHNDAVHVDLARIYLYALILGFQGKFRDTADAAALAAYRQKLFVMIFGKSPSLYREKIDLFALAPLQPVAEDVVPLLPSPRLWIALPAAVILLWIGLSFLLWGRIAHPVKTALGAGAALSSTGGH